ncbi:MAG: hypothetical protein GY757_55880 [bacterium]|nr:hypothetical protein [bacterium]
MTPILGKDDATIYLEKLKEISDVLLKETGALKDNIGLMGGKVGVALFFFYYAQLTMNEEHIDFGHGLLGEVFDAINNEFSLHTFAGGLAGVGWVVEHLAGNDFIEADTDEILEVLDPFLHKTMTYDIEKGNYDFLHGAVGNGTYFLSRLPNEGAKQKLIELVDHLDKMATRKADGLIAWESELDREKKTRGFNLSLSHGISSIIVFLSKVLEQGIHKEKVSELLEGAVRYILA